MTDTLAEDADAAQPDTFWSRGGGWVITQFPLVGAAAAVSRVGPRLPALPAQAVRWPGVILFVCGWLLHLAGVAGLGRQMTPFTKPRLNVRIEQGGAYRLVRHPIYSCVVVGVLGWALYHGRWSGLLAFVIVAVFFDQKASSEERWLVAQTPEYPEYRARVRKLVPWVY